MGRSSLALVCLFLIYTTSGLRAEVNFPATRNAVGPDEYYRLDSFQPWEVWCLREEDGADVCHVQTPVTALDYGLELAFEVHPYLPKTTSDLDVDVVPEAILQIYTFSEAEHYKWYSAAILTVDGNEFDGYWCPTTEVDSCFRGPLIQKVYLDRLMKGSELVVTVLSSADSPDAYKEITQIEVSLDGFDSAIVRATEFTAEAFGVALPIDPDIMLCNVSVEGKERRIAFEYEEDFDAKNTSLREGTFGPKGDGDCPSYVSLALLTPEMTPNQRQMFCMVHDNDRDTISGIQLGEQDPYRICKAPSKNFCQRVNDSKDAALAIGGFVSGTVGGAVGTASVTGTTVVAHSSGAAILTGGSGYVAGTLGTIGTTALGVLTAPATVTAAAVSVVALGGAVYVCSG